LPRLRSVPGALPIALFLSIAAGGCDPDAPGASGTISLGSGVDATAFQALAIRSFPNWLGAYDPSMQIEGDAYQENEAVAALEFPYQYRISGTVGTSRYADWEMVAWLSHRPPGDLIDWTGPEPGDARCSVAFRVAACGYQGGYCGVTSGVDCVLAASPASP